MVQMMMMTWGKITHRNRQGEAANARMEGIWTAVLMFNEPLPTFSLSALLSLTLPVYQTEQSNEIPMPTEHDDASTPDPMAMLPHGPSRGRRRTLECVHPVDKEMRLP